MNNIIDLDERRKNKEANDVDFKFKETHTVAFEADDHQLQYGLCPYCGCYEFYAVLLGDTEYIAGLECKGCKKIAPLKPGPDFEK